MTNKIHKITLSFSDDAIARLESALWTKKVLGSLSGWQDGFCMHVLMALKKAQKGERGKVEIPISSGFESYDDLLVAAE